MVRSTFWSEQCPSRGAALSHAHWNVCTAEAHPGEDSGHLPFQCCHCRGLDPAAKAMSTPAPIDVSARLVALGLMPSHPQEKTMDPEPAAPEHDEFTPVEPKAVTGGGPTGTPFGIGRGELTPRFRERVIKYVEYAKVRGEVPGE